MSDRRRRAKDIQDEIRTVLLREWDPIGIGDVDEAQDEYDAYVGTVYRLLASGAGAQQIAEQLLRIETLTMGIDGGTVESLIPVARRLISLDIRMEP